MRRCPECDFELLKLVTSGHGETLYDCVYDESRWAEASTQILVAVDEIADAIVSFSAAKVRQARSDEWSAIEYACHVRDVLMYQRERVLRSLRGFGLEVLPMGCIERAVHDGYRDQDPADVAVQIRQTAKLFVNLLARLEPDEWDATVTYMFPTEGERSIRWVAVHTAHEAVHHRHDVDQRAI